MKFAIFRCCTTPTNLKYYEPSTDAVLERLGIEIVNVPEFNCCGYPFKNFNMKAYVHASARNLALGAKKSLDVLTVCNCCYGSLKHAEHALREDPSLREEINAGLQKEGLTYEGGVAAKHLLQVFHDEIGVEEIRKKIRRTFSGLRVATHYGCHLLRPAKVVGFDSPFLPAKFDRLVEATGAESIGWPAKLDCCGSPLLGINDELSMDLTEKKLKDAKRSGADCLCVVCPYCQLQFERVQKAIASQRGRSYGLPSILYPQLLGLSMGMDPKILGIDPDLLPPAMLSAA